MCGVDCVCDFGECVDDDEYVERFSDVCFCWMSVCDG